MLFDLNNNTIHVPLKTWNLNTGSTGLEHGIEESIPKAKVSYDITNGSLNCWSFILSLFVIKLMTTIIQNGFRLLMTLLLINDEGKDVPYS